jgi:hypothetical protein
LDVSNAAKADISGVRVQTTLLVHPAFHSYFQGFCACLTPGTRLAFFARTPRAWLAAHGFNQAAPPGVPVFVACIDKPDSSLFREWIVFPCAIAVLLLICSLQVSKVKALWNRYTETSWHKKQQHDPGYLIIEGDKCTERAKADPLWYAAPPRTAAAAAPARVCHTNGECSRKVPA